MREQQGIDQSMDWPLRADSANSRRRRVLRFYFVEQVRKRQILAGCGLRYSRSGLNLHPEFLSAEMTANLRGYASMPILESDGRRA